MKKAGWAADRLREWLSPWIRTMEYAHMNMIEKAYDPGRLSRPWSEPLGDRSRLQTYGGSLSSSQMQITVDIFGAWGHAVGSISEKFQSTVPF